MSGYYSNCASNEDVEQVDRSYSALEHFGQKARKWPSLDGGYIEQYCDGSLSVAFYMQFGGGAERSHKFAAGADCHGEVLKDVIVFVACTDPVNLRSVDYREQELVLIHDVELIECPEGKISSSVGLYFVDEQIGQKRAPLTYWSTYDSTLKFITPIAHDESSVFAGRFKDRGGVIPHQIQGTTEIVQYISDDDRCFIRKRFSDLELKDIVSRLFVFMDSERIEVSPNELANQGIKLIDVAIGPIDFQARTIEHDINQVWAVS